MKSEGDAEEGLGGATSKRSIVTQDSLPNFSPTKVENC